MIPWLQGDTPFPPIEQARRRPNGLLAAGGDLSPARLLDAYRHGIFPWFNAGEPILWWSPDPRMVLFVEELHISRSLQRTLRRGRFQTRMDTCFGEVIQRCAEPRPGQAGTWITAEMTQAYVRLHELGHAHSVETWCDGALVGGLYGVHRRSTLGGSAVFFGESMFSRMDDASKVALVHLVEYCKQRGIGLIDCQQDTPHTASLGARTIPRAEFKRWLETKM